MGGGRGGGTSSLSWTSHTHYPLQDKRSLRLRASFVVVHFASLFLSIYFYWRHNTYCEPYGILPTAKRSSGAGGGGGGGGEMVEEKKWWDGVLFKCVTHSLCSDVSQ